MSFADLKRSRGNNLAALVGEVEKAQKGGSRPKDERFWAPTFSTDKTASALIRFLPRAEASAQAVPWVRTKSYSFEGPGGKYYEQSPITLGLKDPVAEYNSAQWNTNDPVLQEQVRARKQKISYYANILVLKDSEKPENEGKVFLYKFGVKIFDKIKEALNPDPKLGEEGRNVFDFWDGADFKLKGCYVNKFPNYDRSTFSNPSPLFAGDEAKLQEVYSKLYVLDEFLDPKNFKSYDELKTKMSRVLGLGSGTGSTRVTTTVEAHAETTVLDKQEESAPTAQADDDDDSFSEDEKSYLQKLANDET